MAVQLLTLQKENDYIPSENNKCVSTWLCPYLVKNLTCHQPSTPPKSRGPVWQQCRMDQQMSPASLYTHAVSCETGSALRKRIILLALQEKTDSIQMEGSVRQMNGFTVIKHTPTCTSGETGSDCLGTHCLSIYMDSCRKGSKGREIMCSIKL